MEGQSVARMFWSLWLLWQSTILSFMLLIVFMLYRQSMQARENQHLLEKISTMLVTWATNWGQAPEEVRSSLLRVIEGMKTPGKKPSIFRRIGGWLARMWRWTSRGHAEN